MFIEVEVSETKWINKGLPLKQNHKDIYVYILSLERG